MGNIRVIKKLNIQTLTAYVVAFLQACLYLALVNRSSALRQISDDSGKYPSFLC